MSAKSKFDHIKVGDYFNSVLVLRRIRVGVNNSLGAVFKCHCNKTFERSFSNVARGQTSCKDCSKYAAASAKHKYIIKDRRLYRIWKCMNSRCHNPKDPQYYLYGGRGINVCDEWRDSSRNGFNTFYADMGIYPTTKHSVDRIDGNKGYSRDNCRWATQKEQMNNVRSNHIVNFEGVQYTLQQISDKFGIDSNKVLCRLQRGYPVEEALKEKPDIKVITVGDTLEVVPVSTFTFALYGKEEFIRELVRKGYNISEISAETGASWRTVKTFVSDFLGIRIRHTRVTKSGVIKEVGSKFSLSQEDLHEVYRLKDSGVTNTSIAKTLGKSISSVGNVLEKFYD